MVRTFDTEIKLTDRVRLALYQATQIVAWAARLENPLETITWVEGIEISELRPLDLETGIFRYDQAEAGIQFTPRCEITVRLEVDGDHTKKFWVILELVNTARAGWRVSECRSGEPGCWFQIHYPNGYAGIKTEYLTLINSRTSLEKIAAERSLFQFPFRDVPAPVK